MFPADGDGEGNAPVGEPFFLSSDVARMAAVSLRQLQWWDERKVVSPSKRDHRRLYAPTQVLEVLIVAGLRRKGLSLQKIRRVLRSLRRELGETLKRNGNGGSKLFILTDGQAIRLEARPDRLLQLLTDAKRAMYVISLSDQVKRIASDKASRRYLARQLPLF